MAGVESHRDLEVYQLAFALAVEVDHISKSLPKYEMYEEGSQLRRAAKSIPANLAEGFGRRRYTQEYIRFIVFALASCDETRVHLDLLYRTGSLAEDLYQHLTQQYDILGKRLNKFLQGVINQHQEPYR